MRVDFTTFKRRLKGGRFLYYVRFYNKETRELITTRSSGKTKLKEAYDWAYQQIQEGEIFTATSKQNPLFQTYTENWFLWDKCPFIKKQLVKGKRFSRGHADNRRGMLENHLLPYFGEMKLRDIKVCFNFCFNS